MSISDTNGLSVLRPSGGVHSASKTSGIIKDYVASRRAFSLLRHQIVGARWWQSRVPSAIDSDLTIDSIFIPPLGRAGGLVIVSSGVHGPEAPLGVALQMQMMQTIAADPSCRTETGYLFVHCVNPFGYKYGRRVSENNVDLNRNFVLDNATFKLKNAAYRRHYGLLNPDDPVSINLQDRAKLLLALLRATAFSGRTSLTFAIGLGQYEFPRGIMYGGSEHEPHVQIVNTMVDAAVSGFSSCLVLDIHTGYGPKGALQLMPNPTEDSLLLESWAEIFESKTIGPEGGAKFYASSGDFSGYFSGRLTERGIITIPMLIELGTLDSHKVVGTAATIQRIIRENQLHWFGAVDPTHEQIVAKEFKDLFCPVDPVWQAACVQRGSSQMMRYVKNFSKSFNLVH